MKRLLGPFIVCCLCFLTDMLGKAIPGAYGVETLLFWGGMMYHEYLSRHFNYKEIIK